LAVYTRQITSKITALTSVVDIPMIGVLPINSFLVTGDEPMLVDTGITPERSEFIAALGELLDPADLRWIWLTHADRDHTGAISELLELAPNARIVTTHITLGLMGAGDQPIPPSRAFLVRDGSAVPMTSGSLVAMRPPLFDNPGTAGFFDPASRVHSVDETKFADSLSVVRNLGAEVVLSTHLPPIRGDVDRYLRTISRLPSAPPTLLPDQAALETAVSLLAHGA